MLPASEQSHWIRISVEGRFPNRPHLHAGLEWSGLPFETRMKFDWYFRYRAALLQVEYPKGKVKINFGHQRETNPERLERLYNNRLVAKKATITKTKNRIAKAEELWDRLFPIEDDFNYQRAKIKLTRLENELSEMDIKTFIDPLAK